VSLQEKQLFHLTTLHVTRAVQDPESHDRLANIHDGCFPTKRVKAWIGPEGYRRLRLPDFKTIDS
jgi:hypothetical protein